MNKIVCFYYSRGETVVINGGLDLVKLEKAEDRINLLLPVDSQNVPVSLPYLAK